ncbi:MAG: nucleotide sugar dehydrogenase, partial [Pseudomonadales bacterium]|nr:nucleotide sugar dehydrogenase [Pseudomonadales bacterium]
RISEVDVVILCVPTPLTANREPDLQFVEGSLEQVLPHLTAGQMLCLESTTYPGTTREKLAPRLVESGFSLGEDFFLAYSPEREDPGNEHFGMSDIPKVCAGMTENCLDVVTTLYASVVRAVVPVSSLDAAEMTKLLENVHRAVNIGLANEMKVVADAMDIDIYEVIEAAATKPFGFVPYYPGPGLGGHCIPIDPYYLTWRAKQIGVDTRFVELAGEINNAMPNRVIEKTIAALGEAGVSVDSSNVLVLGVAYKKNVSDTRESPAMKIIQLLEAEGAKVNYSDPLVPVMPKLRDYDFSHRSLDVTPDLVSRHDCVLVITDHDDFDYALIEKHARILIDTRGRYRDSARPIVSA